MIQENHFAILGFAFSKKEVWLTLLTGWHKNYVWNATTYRKVLTSVIPESACKGLVMGNEWKDSFCSIRNRRFGRQQREEFKIITECCRRAEGCGQVRKK